MTGYGKIRDNLKMNEIDKPEPGKNEVLIEVYAAGINPVDYKILGGAFKQVSSLSFPAPIGYDLSGVVIKPGSGVSKFKRGDAVYARVPSESPGTFAEYISVNSSVVAKKPDNLSFEEAAGIPLVGLTTLQALALAEIKSGDRILIHAGSGGIGTFAIQYAKSRGAYVYTTTSTPNVSWVKKLGADRVIDYKKENYLNSVKDIDIVFDTLGHEFTLDAFQVIKEGGKVVSIAGEVDETTAGEFGLGPVIRFMLSLKRRKITKAMKKKSASYRFLLMKPNASQLEAITSLLEKKQIVPVIDKVFDFSMAIDALVYLEQGRAKGKVVLKMK